jgi:hypothetical protein
MPEGVSRVTAPLASVDPIRHNQVQSDSSAVPKLIPSPNPELRDAKPARPI